MAETVSSAIPTTENDINAEDLSRDLLRQRNHPQAATSIPSEPENKPGKTLVLEQADAPWFKVEIIVFKQTVTSVTEEFPEQIEYTPSDKLITLKGFDYPEQHHTRASNHNINYASYVVPSFSETSDASLKNGPVSDENSDISAHTPESALRNESDTDSLKENLPSAYTQEALELLTEAQKRLEKSPNYEILLATAWKQPTVTKEESPTLHLTAGNWYDDQPEFEAFIKISKQRYLHAYADLFLKRYSLKSEQTLPFELGSDVMTLDSSASAAGNTFESSEFMNQGIQPHHFQLFSLDVDHQLFDQTEEHTSSYITNEVFSIKEDRIMKHSKDLYYLDHPKFGMIIKVTPLDQLEENE
jgi:hypothetical protein